MSEGSRGSAGFTLLELIVVLVILGLMLTLVVAHGPFSSRTLTARAAAGEIAGALREARSRAIGIDRPVSFTMNLARRTFRVDDRPAQSLPPGYEISLLTTTGEVVKGRDPGIRFDPDGSSTGGRVVIADGRHKLEVGVDWLTGRIKVADVKG